MSWYRMLAGRSSHGEGGLVWQCINVPFERSALVFAEGLAVVVVERVWGVVFPFWGEHAGIRFLSTCEDRVARSVSSGSTPSEDFGRNSASHLVSLGGWTVHVLGRF
jgi:hypothetical protein